MKTELNPVQVAGGIPTPIPGPPGPAGPQGPPGQQGPPGSGAVGRLVVHRAVCLIQSDGTWIFTWSGGTVDAATSLGFQVYVNGLFQHDGSWSATFNAGTWALSFPGLTLTGTDQVEVMYFEIQ